MPEGSPPAPDPDADEQANIVYLTKNSTEKWLPAAEIHGEGVFIEFNRDTLAKWLNSPEVKALSEKYSECYKSFCESKGWTITVQRNATYVLLHTSAHLLIKQMSMSSGYSSSAIRERIYYSDKMSGLLLYTGSADKEGSLGGLVELGTIDNLNVLMKDAFQEALLCTNDPECLNNSPAGNNSNGAACHSCCMISETACENGNRMLVYYSLRNFVNWTSGTGAGTANRMVGGMAKVNLSLGEDGQWGIATYSIVPLVSHVEEGYGKVTTYFLEDYSEELAEQNEIKKQDETFSYSYILELCEDVWGNVLCKNDH